MDIFPFQAAICVKLSVSVARLACAGVSSTVIRVPLITGLTIITSALISILSVVARGPHSQLFLPPREGI